MLAIIPARGGSKGLPGKNIRMLCGKPLIAYTIEEALKAKSITRVIVSTDCDDIAEIAIKYGAEVPFKRPEALATDDAKAIDVYTHLLDSLYGSVEVAPDNCLDCVVLLPTCPLRIASDIDNAVFEFYSKSADSVISYTEENHPIVWHRYLNNDGTFENIFPDTIENRQDERVSYYPNGAIYVFKRKLLNEGKYYSEKTYAYLMDRKRSVDIDTLDDFNYAEYLLRKDREILICSE